MALQNFIDKAGPVVSAAWLNVVDILKETVFGNATTKAAARTALTSDAPLEPTNGGTGQRSLANAWTALLGNNTIPVANLPVAPIEKGGTGVDNLTDLGTLVNSLVDFSAVPVFGGLWTSSGSKGFWGNGSVVIAYKRFTAIGNNIDKTVSYGPLTIQSWGGFSVAPVGVSVDYVRIGDAYVVLSFIGDTAYGTSNSTSFSVNIICGSADARPTLSVPQTGLVCGLRDNGQEVVLAKYTVIPTATGITVTFHPIIKSL